MIGIPDKPRVALAHDWLVGLRGGEWVLDRLARKYGPTDLYALVNDGHFVTDSISACDVVTSPLQRFPGAAGRLRRHYLPLMPWAVGRLHVQPCDLLISTSSAVMKAVQSPPRVPHLCYCHTPARYLWEQTHEYATGAGGIVRRAGLTLCGSSLRRWDRRTADRVTRFIANSRHTAGRIRRCYGRESVVIHPPVRTDFFTVDEAVSREDWLLVVAALEPYKRTDLVIDAANRAGVPVRIVGCGSQRGRLDRMAGPTVEFLGRVDDNALRDLYRRARALVFPQLEDFGIIAVEAQACGCPIIAYAAGGALDIVTDETSVLMREQTADAVITAVESLDRRTVCGKACRRNAERFSADEFDRRIDAQVQALLAQATSSS